MDQKGLRSSLGIRPSLQTAEAIAEVATKERYNLVLNRVPH